MGKGSLQNLKEYLYLIIYLCTMFESLLLYPVRVAIRAAPKKYFNKPGKNQSWKYIHKTKYNVLEHNSQEKSLSKVAYLQFGPINLPELQFVSRQC